MPWYQTYPHRREDYITKLTNVNPGGECPLWLNFIEFVTNGDKEFARYLQILSGYACIGLRNEQMFAFLYGSGNNGKSTFIRTIAWVLGDYAVTVNADVFLYSSVPRHSEELMPLRGARLVIASEIPPDARWNESRIKQLTGGEPVRARGMNQNSIQFTPQCLIVLTGNDKPHLKSVDVAIKRRLHLVPFTSQIGEDMRDKKLDEKLKAEGGGILAWMLEGCRIWQDEGLHRPTAVETATDAYLADEDTFGQWRDECTEPAIPGGAHKDLYASYKTYAEAAGVRPASGKAFTQLAEAAGFKADRISRNGRQTRCILGLDIKPIY